MKLSARNQLKGTIVDVMKGADHVAYPDRYRRRGHRHSLDHQRGSGRTQAGQGQGGDCRDQGQRRHGRRRLIDRRTLIAGLSAALIAPRRRVRGNHEGCRGARRADPRQGIAGVSRRAAGGDPALYAGAGIADRLAARQPAGRMRLHAAGDLHAAGSRAHHRPRQHRQSGNGAGAEARSHSRRRLDQRHFRLAGGPGAGANQHSLRAAGRPLRRHRHQLPLARRLDRPAARMPKNLRATPRRR